MSTLVSVDPGLRYPAVAIFKDGILQWAGRVKIPTANHKVELGQRCMNVAKLIANQVSNYKVDELVIEWPRTYFKSGKADPADLFPLAGVGMAVAGMLGVPVVAPTAPEWIGNVPKTTTGDPLGSIRGRRIWDRLSEAERACVVLSHDALDAVGLGLWKLGRLEARKSFIGATQ